jgi:hypothetical protein
MIIETLKRSRPRIFTASLCLIVLGLTGCMSANVRRVQIGRVTAYAHLTKGVASYHEIEIQEPAAVGAPGVLLQLPNGRVLDRKSFTYDTLKQAGLISPEGQDYQPGNTYSNELSRYGLSFFFLNGRLMLLRLSETTGPGPAVGIAGERSKQFYHLPMTEDELHRLFGRPDRSKDEFRI